MKFKQIVIILSIVGVIVLYFLATLSQPLAIGLSELPKNEGKQVIVEGVVTTYYLTAIGGQIISIRSKDIVNDTAVATIFVQETTSVEVGDAIRVTGKVQQYKGEWELVVENQQFLSNLQKEQNITCPLWQLAFSPDRYIGLPVTVSGDVENSGDGFFSLVDGEKKHSLFVVLPPSFHKDDSFEDVVVVSGVFSYDSEKFQFFLQADTVFTNDVVDEGG